MNTKTTLKGYQICAGIVRERFMYATREEAAKHIGEAKAEKAETRGFAVRYGSVVATVSRIVRGKWRHQEAGGKGYHWDDNRPPYATRKEAHVVVVRGLREALKRKKLDVRRVERELAKAVKK
jgi:hypothetical protein